MTNDSRDSWIFSLLGDPQFQRQRGFLAWWYKLTSPPDIEHPSLAQRDVARRAKILSALALFLAGLLLFVAYIALSGPNKQIIATVYVLYPTILLCLLLNRFQHINLAGVLLIFALNGGMYLTLGTTAFLHGGLTPNDKDILYLPVFGELVAAALLPTVAIFLVALLNTGISLFFLYAAPHTLAFTAMLASGASSITFRIVEIHFFVTLVCWIVATWTLISVKQANRAAELARLAHDLHAEATEKLRQKEQVEQGMHEIVRVHTQVANGRADARVHLAGEHVLWQIAVPLNNLLGRYQQATRRAEERDVYFRVLNQLVETYPALRQPATRSLQECRQVAPPAASIRPPRA
ncbi:MAG: hypothetical protein ACRDHW_09710 [Ktedonobacteraceae bacterium]